MPTKQDRIDCFTKMRDDCIQEAINNPKDEHVWLALAERWEVKINQVKKEKEQ